MNPRRERYDYDRLFNDIAARTSRRIAELLAHGNGSCHECDIPLSTEDGGNMLLVGGRNTCTLCASESMDWRLDTFSVRCDVLNRLPRGSRSILGAADLLYMIDGINDPAYLRAQVSVPNSHEGACNPPQCARKLCVRLWYRRSTVSQLNGVGEHYLTPIEEL